MQGDLAERPGRAQNQDFFTLLDLGFFQWNDGTGSRNAHADCGFIVDIVRHIPHFGLRHQGALCPGTKWQHRAFPEIHPTAIRRTAYAFAANDTGVLHTETVGAEYIPAPQASGIDIDQYRAVLRLRLTKLLDDRQRIALGNNCCTHGILLVCFILRLHSEQ
ncbi:hypothetical protein D3C84_696600 [compost metagenome]